VRGYELLRILQRTQRVALLKVGALYIYLSGIISN